MIDFLLFFVPMLVVMYPVHGAIVYGDPWTWIFKKEPTDDH